MEKLCLELESFRPIPMCVCEVMCSCTLIPAIIAHKESNYVIMFLRGLNDSLVNIRSQIMMMTPLLDVEKDFNLLTQQERQMSQDLDESKILVNNSVSYKKKIRKKTSRDSLQEVPKVRRVEASPTKFALIFIAMDIQWTHASRYMASLLTLRR
jgi:hypothetical protein